MKASRVVFCWFSGTGNTERVVRRMTEVFSGAGLAVETCRIGRDPFPGLEEGDALGLGFPVAYQATYPFVWDFVDRLPEGRGAEAFMVDTLGGFSGGVVGPLRRIVSRKGYDPVGAREIRMPMNFGSPRKREESSRALVAEGVRKAAAYAEDLLLGTARWRRVPLLSDLMFLVHAAAVSLLFTRWNQRHFKVRVDREACTGCGACAGACPAGNVRMPEASGARPLPAFGDRCTFCLACLAVCPSEALSSPLNRAGRYVAPDPGDAGGGRDAV